MQLDAAAAESPLFFGSVKAEIVEGDIFSFLVFGVFAVYPTNHFF